MPEPSEYDNEQDWMHACVPAKMDEGKTQEQAVGACMGIWADHMGKKTDHKIEYKAMPLSVAQIEGRTVKSLFAVMGHVDDGGDRILPGAFRKTLSEHTARVKVLWQHDAAEPPVGKPLLMKELSKDDLTAEYKAQWPSATGALYGEVEYLDTPRGNEVLEGIRKGAITENSIGYDALQFDWAQDNGAKVRQLKELRLWDISPVNWGMQPAAVNLKSAVERFSVGELQGDSLANELVKVFQYEQKYGRVLSASNMERIKRAMQELMDTLMTAAEPPEDPEISKALTENLRLRLAIAEREIIGG